MNWEETILDIRTMPEHEGLVKDAYLGADLEDNVKRFRASQEYKTTIQVLSAFNKPQKAIRLLDIGAGNGISSIAFALDGYAVTALEPDPSATIGAAAIRRVANIFKVEDKVNVVEAWGEKLPFEDASFDIVYGRQVMHHAHNLKQFVEEAARVLKQGGIFMTTRDHVIKDEQDKERFLARHPLHKYYGGENAFTLEEYQEAITNAGLKIERSLDAAQTPINYDPWGKKRVKEKLGILGSLPFVPELAMSVVKYRLNNISGRLHTFVAIK